LRREFEGVENQDAVSISGRRERHRNLFQRISDNHQDPSTALKPYFVMAVLTMIVSPFPFWSEAFVLITILMAVFNTNFRGRLWDAPFRVPFDLGRRGFKDRSSNEPGDGTIYHGIGRGEFAGQEVWSSDKDGQTHRLVVGTTGSGKSEEIFGLVFNALCQNSGTIMVDGKASADTLSSMKKICRLFGRDEDFLVLGLMLGAKDLSGLSETKPTNTFNPFSRGSSDQKSTLMEVFMPPAEGNNAVFAQRALQLNKALSRPLTFLHEAGYVNYSPALLTEFFVLNNVENLVYFGRFMDKFGRVVDLPGEGRHEEFLRLKQACSALEAVLMDLPGYTQVLPKTAPALINAKDTQIANALLGDENDIAVLSRDLMDRHSLLAGPLSDGGSDGPVKPKNQSTEATRAEVYRQWGFMTMSLSGPAATLAQTYGHVFNAEMGELSMNDVFLNRRVVFVMIPSLEKAGQSLATLGKITVAAIKQVLANLLHRPLEGEKREIVDASPSRSQTSFKIIFDEYGYYVVEGFSVVAAQARSFGVSLTFGMQSPLSLERASKAESDETIGNTNLRFVGRFQPGAESQSWQLVRGWGGKKSVLVTKSKSVEKAAFKSDVMSDELAYDDIDTVNYADVGGQQNGQFHLMVGLQTAEGRARRGENRVVRLQAFYTGDVPDALEWRLNHFVEVKPPDPRAIEAIITRGKQDRLINEASCNGIKDWSLKQGNPLLCYHDHNGGDAVAKLMRDVVMVLSAVVDDAAFQNPYFVKFGAPNLSWSADAFVQGYEAMIQSGYVSDAQLDRAILEALQALDDQSSDAEIHRELGQYTEDLMTACELYLREQVIDAGEAMAAFGAMMRNPQRSFRRRSLQHAAVARRVKDAGRVVASE
jgi:intracellular multiplication protein IcmO